MSIKLFDLGETLITAHARDVLLSSEVQTALARHASGDWGEVCEEDRKQNDLALSQELRLFSVYCARDGTKFWIITESDRSVTTILLPEDY
jgi:hypothetical protein